MMMCAFSLLFAFWLKHDERDVLDNVGDRYVVDAMRKKGYNVGGEASGHIVLSDFGTTGDGLVAALQILACMQESQIPMSQLCKRFESVPQILKNVKIKNKNVLKKDPVKAAIDQAIKRLEKRHDWSFVLLGT